MTNEEEYGTPRPGTMMDEKNATERQNTAARQAMFSFSFAQAAKHAAAASKRRRSPKARTDYWMMNKHVIEAFNELETQINATTGMMTQADFNLLKQAIRNFRVKLIVHDSLSFEELKQLQDETRQKEVTAEQVTHDAFIDKTPGNDQAYFDAKDRYLELKAWSAELKKEVSRIEPKVKYTNIGGGLFRHDFNKPAEPPGVPSQHTQIAPASAHALRNILTPETARRTFISLASLTNKIREELCVFLTDAQRHKDRHEVIKQIKEDCVAAALAKKQRNAE
jgi:hypothetical protein